VESTNKKKIGTLNSHLSRVIAMMGDTERIVICDSGLPIPRGAEVVDLALTRNFLRFIDTVSVVIGREPHRPCQLATVVTRIRRPSSSTFLGTS